MAYANKTISNPATGQEIRFVHTARDTKGLLLEMESHFNPGSLEPVPHYHPLQTEHFTVLSGAIMVRLNGAIKVLKTGEALRIPPNTVHSMWNPFEEEAVVSWKMEPALDTEYFLETGMGLAREGKTGKNGMPPLLQVALLANRYADVYRLASPPYWLQKTLFTLLAPFAWLRGYRASYAKYLD
jgi:quercetin dioxygenase-like cupin family protein